MKYRQVNLCIDSDDKENGSIGWNNLPDMVITSEDSNLSDTDGAEWLHNSIY